MSWTLLGQSKHPLQVAVNAISTSAWKTRNQMGSGLINVTKGYLPCSIWSSYKASVYFPNKQVSAEHPPYQDRRHKQRTSEKVHRNKSIMPTNWIVISAKETKAITATQITSIAMESTSIWNFYWVGDTVRTFTLSNYVRDLKAQKPVFTTNHQHHILPKILYDMYICSTYWSSTV